MSPLTFKRNCLNVLGKIWSFLYTVVTWNPGYLIKFTSDSSKRLYTEFLFTNYENQLIGIYILNMMFQASLLGAFVLIRLKKMDLVRDVTIVGSSILFHFAVIILKFWKKTVFKKLYYLLTMVAIVFLLVTIKLLNGSFSAELSFVCAVLYDINVTICFQDSFFLTVLFITFQFILTLNVSVVYSIVEPVSIFSNNTVYEEIPAQFFISLSVSLSCLIVHRLMNKTKRLSFEKIEKSVLTHLDVKKEISKQEKLLNSIFPSDFAKLALQSLYSEESADEEPRNSYYFRKLNVSRSENVSILFADIKGFTALSAKVTAQTLVQTLNELFARFDCLAESNNCMRIKILGDCYYCVSGLYGEVENHAEGCVEMGLQMVEVIRYGFMSFTMLVVFMQFVSSETGYDLSMRVGIHTGSVFCGLIGLKKWQFDIWSHDVTIANQMEASGKPGRVHITQDTYEALKGAYEVEPSNAKERSDFIADLGIETYFIKCSKVDQEYIQKHITRFCSSSNSFGSHLTTGSFCDSAIDVRSSRSSSTSSQNSLCLPGQIEDDFDIVQKHKKMRSVSKAVTRMFAGDYEERRNFGAKEIHRTLGMISRQSKSDVFNAVILSEEYINSLENVVTKEHCTKLWKKYANSYFLSFASKQHETEFIQLENVTLCCFFMAMFLLSILLFAAEIVILPRYHVYSALVNIMTILLILSLMVAVFVKTYYYVPPTIDKFVELISKNRHARYLLFTAIWFVMFVSSVIGLIECQPNAPLLMPYESFSPQSPRCDFASYYLIIGIILTVVVMLPVFDLPYIGTLLIIVYSLVHVLIILPATFFDTFYVIAFSRFGLMALKHTIVLNAFIILVMIFLTCYGMFILWQFKYTLRVNFLQTLEIKEQQKKVEVAKAHNFVLLSNILPKHVIHHFLEPDGTSDLYYHSHDKVGVMFASIPSFSDFYNEKSANNQGLECLRLLNEIFADFDQLLKEERFSSLEKIKTIGSTYMIASGLQGERNIGWKHLAVLADFSFALREKLHLLNINSFTNFQLRIGINHGPIVAGVIGARKPQYDIWGDTVNLASRMDGTGVMGKTQVVQETKNILQSLGYSFDFRGSVNVKGKGELVTYFLVDKTSPSKAAIF